MKFRLDFDVYIQGSSQVGQSGEALLVVDEVPLLQVSFTTMLLP